MVNGDGEWFCLTVNADNWILFIAFNKCAHTNTHTLMHTFKYGIHFNICETPASQPTNLPSNERRYGIYSANMSEMNKMKTCIVVFKTANGGGCIFSLLLLFLFFFGVYVTSFCFAREARMCVWNILSISPRFHCYDHGSRCVNSLLYSHFVMPVPFGEWVFFCCSLISHPPLNGVTTFTFECVLTLASGREKRS